MREIKNLKQETAGGRRRWFESDGLELVFWLDDRDTVVGFQLCYDFGRGAHALTWRTAAGFTHCVIDAGDDSPLKNETPVLGATRETPWDEVIRGFDRASAGLEPYLRQLVQKTLTAGAVASRR